MGIWNSIKEAAIKAKCGIGFHAGEFATPEGMPKCYFEKTCPDCKKLITEHRHKYPLDWEEAPYANDSHIRCARIQECEHCGNVEKREIHAKYRKLGINAKCQSILSCERCGHEKKGDYEHNFVRDGKTENGEIIVRCLNCGEKEARKYI